MLETGIRFFDVRKIYLSNSEFVADGCPSSHPGLLIHYCTFLVFFN